MRQHRFQQSERVNRIVAEIFFRNLHGFAGFDERSEMHDRVDAVFLKNAIQRSPVRSVRNDELCAGRNGFLAAVREIVENDDVAAFGEELRSNYAADVPGSSGNKNAIGHLDCPFAASEFLNLSETQELHQESSASASVHLVAYSPEALVASRCSNPLNRGAQSAQYLANLFGAFIFVARPEEAL